jgi:hypothetical protein
MSEYEFLKLNPNLKIYHKIFEKHFPKVPKNTYKISKTLNLQTFTDFLKLPNIKWTVENENYEIKPIFSFQNDDKLTLTMNKKLYVVEIINNTKKKYLKVYL